MKDPSGCGIMFGVCVCVCVCSWYGVFSLVIYGIVK